MANPAVKNGFFPIANELAEQLAGISIPSDQMRIIWVVWRKTWGWEDGERRKDWDWISLTQFEKMTGMNRRNVSRSLKSLVAKRLLLKHNELLKFNQNYNEWVVAKRLLGVAEMVKGGSLNGKRGVAKRLHTKETIQKKLTKETILPSVDDEVIKKPLTIIQEIVNYFFELRGVKPSNESYSRWVRVAKQIASASGNDVFIAKNKIKDIADWANSKGLEWTLDTVLKRFDLGATLDKKEQLQKDREFLTNLKNKNYGN